MAEPSEAIPVAPPRRGGAAQAVAPLRDYPAFRHFWTSSVLFFSGFWGQTVVLAWLAFDLTRSEFAVALFTAARFGPLLAGPAGGALADRVNRVRLLAAAQLVALLSAAAMALLVALGVAAYWHVVLAGLLLGAMHSPLQPARFTLLMDLVRREDVSSANALNMASLLGSRVVAPAIAGWLISVAGAAVALLSAAVWYVPGALILLRVTEPAQRAPVVGVGILAEMLQGLRVATRHREMAGVLIVSVAANSLAWPILQAFLPVFAEQVLESDATGLGLLFAANGVGALLGALAIATLGDFRGKGVLFLGSTALFGLSLSAFALMRSMPPAMALMFLGGIASAGFGVMQSTLMLLLAPEDQRGRVMGVLMLSIGVMPFATLLQGAAASTFGVVPTTFASGLALAVAMAAIWIAVPGLRRAR